MKIIIVGCGRVGVALCEQLVAEGHDIIVIDSDSKKVEYLVDTYDVMGINGNGASSDIQKEATVSNSDILIACTPSDELNIICCMVAKKLGAKETIARIRKPEYYNLFMSNELGLSLMVNPEYEAAKEIYRILNFPSANKVERFADGQLELIEYRIPQNSGLVGVQLKNFRNIFENKVLVCAAQREDEALIPGGDYTFEESDKVHFVGKPKEIHAFFKSIGASKGRYKKIMLLGGGRLAFYLAKELAENTSHIKIIERDLETCRELEDSLENVEVIRGNGFDQEILMEEGIEDVDAVVAVSEEDEKNILISMFALSKNKKVITIIKKDSYLPMLESLGIDSVVSPKSLTANQIIRYVRALRNHDGGDVCTLIRIDNNKAEVLEFSANVSFEGKGVPLKDLNLKKKMLVAGIVRGGEAITPDGSTRIEAGDRVIVVTAVKGINDLNDILS